MGKRGRVKLFGWLGLVAAAILIFYQGDRMRTTARVTPQTFNAKAARMGLPFSWHPSGVKDSASHIPTSDLKFFGVPQLDLYIRKNGAPTPLLGNLIRAVKHGVLGTHPGNVSDELRTTIQKDLDERDIVIFETHFDAKNFTRNERKMVGHILNAGRHIYRLHLLQIDPRNLVFEARVAGLADPLALELFYNSQAPWTEKISQGAAIFTDAKRAPGEHLYPAEFTAADYAKLANEPNGAELTSPFVAVEKTETGYKAIPFSQHPLFKDEMQAVARELRLAAAFARHDRDSSKDEWKSIKAFRDYLRAVADAFESPLARPFDKADELWVKLPTKSKWALRIGPDETYWDGNIRGHAGFQIHFGISDSTAQQFMAPYRKYGFQNMESDFATLIGVDAYKGRVVTEPNVKFMRPILAEGGARKAHGMTSAFSLPNWGDYSGEAKVIRDLETPDSQAKREFYFRTFFGDDYVQYAVPGMSTFDTITHELFHGFGPQSDDQISDLIRPNVNSNGAPISVRDAISPGLQQTLEEAKASVVHFWFDQQLVDKNLSTELERKQKAAAGLSWALSHLSVGIYTDAGNIRDYSAVGALIVGHFMETGAMSYDESRGKWDIDFDKVVESGASLVKQIARIQATGDRDGAQAMIDKFTLNEETLNMMRYEEAQLLRKTAGLKPTVGRYQVVID